MAQYHVEFSDELGMSFDVPPGAPRADGFDISFRVGTEQELRHAVDVLGFDAAALDPTKDLHSRYGLPVTRDGDAVARCTVYLWLGDGVTRQRVESPPIAALASIVDEAKAARREDERRVQAEKSVAWAQSVGRPVGLSEDGRIVERSDPLAEAVPANRGEGSHTAGGEG